MSNQPLISIGIPTYNRPEGLKRTLETITSQTIKNLEIIVSDNCSDSPNVKDVIEDFKKRDKRIISFIQETNIGIINNFKFVLEKASGEYFMWAADDDEWNVEFIEELMSIIGDHSAAFCNYSIAYRSIDKTEDISISNSASGKTRYEQARNFLLERIPSMFYSIYKKDAIIWFLQENEIFDWFDCYAVFKIILLSDGFMLSHRRLYTAGIKGTQYENKPFNPSTDRIYTYGSYVKRSIAVILKSGISFKEKLKLIFYLLEVNAKAFLFIETKRKNYRFYFVLYKICSFFSPKVNIIRLY